MTTDTIETALVEADQETALAKAQTDLDALLADDPNLLDMWGGENLEEGDTGQPPRLKLCQPSTPDATAEPGQFYDSLTGEVFAAAEVVPLLPLPPTRVDHYEPYKRGESPLCASDDGEMPRQPTSQRPLQAPQPGPCATCERSQWTEDGSGNRTKPSCARQRNFALMVRNSGEVVLLTMQRTGTPTARNMTSLMKKAGIRKSIILTSKHIDGDSGSYYEPVASAGGRLLADELLRVIEARREIQRLVSIGEISMTADEEVDANGSSGGSGNGGNAPAQPRSPGAEALYGKADFDLTQDEIPF